MRNRLKLLIYITALAGVGVILLQLNWLQRSYTTSREKFNEDIDNTIVQSAIFVNSVAMMPKAQLKNPAILLVVALMSSAFSDAAVLVEKSLENEMITDNKENNLPYLVSLPLFGEAYKEFFKKGLQKKDIDIPFEIAFFDKKGKMMPSTTDSSKFQGLPVKMVVKLPDINLYSDYRIQVAFPNITFYLLKQMIWELVISIVLILIFLISFIYMIRIFFRQKKFSELKSDFMNNMTHELKTPISSVSIALEFIQNESIPLSAKKEYASIAQNELKRLTILVEKVLKMAAFEKSEIRINPEKINAVTWINDVISANRPILNTKNAIINHDIQLARTVICIDKVHFTNVIQNLIDNAIKYNDKLHTCINVSLWEDEQEIYISIADNGRGISEKYINNIFDKFFRVPSKEVHEIKGYGLGLSYVKAVVDLHKGNITVKSKIKEGTTFIISIPKIYHI